MFQLVALVLSAPTQACSNDGKRHVVGWTEDGSKALVRVEHNDDEGRVHELSLHLLGAAGREKTWEILSVKDNSDRAVRGERWKAAEPEIAAAGIALLPGQTPLAGDAADGSCVRSQVPIPDQPYSLEFRTERESDSMSLMQYNLYAISAGKHHLIRKLYEDGGGGGGGTCVGSYWLAPQRQSLVVLSGYGYPIMALFPLKDVEAKLKEAL